MTRRFAFAWSPSYRLAALPFAVTPARAWVALDEEHLEARFGPWRVRTPRANVVGATVTGPYAFVKNAGPAHLGLTDRSLSFVTNPERGICLDFAEPVTGIEPTGRLKHPRLTVTVAEWRELADALGG